MIIKMKTITKVQQNCSKQFCDGFEVFSTCAIWKKKFIKIYDRELSENRLNPRWPPPKWQKVKTSHIVVNKYKMEHLL